MTPDYREGRIDGLREAVAIVVAMQEEVELRLSRPAGRVTTQARRVRRQAYVNAATRLGTALRRRERPVRGKVDTALQRLGL